MTNTQRRLYRAYLTFRLKLHCWLYGIKVTECSCSECYPREELQSVDLTGQEWEVGGTRVVQTSPPKENYRGRYHE